MKEEVYCGKSLEEIRALRMKHGKVFISTVKEDEEVYHAICKEPNMQVLQAARSVGKDDELKASMILYDNCVLDADEEIKKRDLLKLQVAASIGQKVATLEASVKNV